MQNAITTRSGVSAWVDDLGRPAVEGALQRACPLDQRAHRHRRAVNRYRIGVELAEGCLGVISLVYWFLSQAQQPIQQSGHARSVHAADPPT
jgi:hypothetical protein